MSEFISVFIEAEGLLIQKIKTCKGRIKDLEGMAQENENKTQKIKREGGNTPQRVIAKVIEASGVSDLNLDLDYVSVMLKVSGVAVNSSKKGFSGNPVWNEELNM